MKINRIFHVSASADSSEEKRKKTQLRQLVMINKNYTKSTHCCAFKTSTRSLLMPSARLKHKNSKLRKELKRFNIKKKQPRMGEEWKNYKTHWTVQKEPVKKKRAQRNWNEKKNRENPWEPECVREWTENCGKFSLCVVFFFASSNHHPSVARSPHSPPQSSESIYEYNIQTCCLLPPHPQTGSEKFTYAEWAENGRLKKLTEKRLRDEWRVCGECAAAWIEWSEQRKRKKLKNYFPRIRAAAEPKNMMSLTLADLTARFYMRAWDFITDGTRLSLSRVMSRDQRMKLQIKA